MTKVVVIHVNAFTRQIAGGYFGHMREGVPVAENPYFSSQADIAKILTENPGIRVEFQYV